MRLAVRRNHAKWMSNTKQAAPPVAAKPLAPVSFERIYNSWYERRTKMSDAAVGRAGENHLQQGTRITNLLADHMAGFYTHGLDYGCGYGRMVPTLAPHCGHLWVADIFDDWVERAADLQKNTTAITLTEFKLPFDDGVFDFVADVMTIQSIGKQHREIVTSELARVAAHGATVLSLHVYEHALHDGGLLPHLLQLGTHSTVMLDNIDEAKAQYCLTTGVRL